VRVSQKTWTHAGGWAASTGKEQNGPADLVLVFGAMEVFNHKTALEELRAANPAAIIVGCSTAGEIAGPHVLDDSLVATAIQFEHTSVRCAHVQLAEGESSCAAGARLAALLRPVGLKHVLVFSDGLAVNGSELAAGISAGLPPEVAVTGGLSGDGTRFSNTLVIPNAAPSHRCIVALGFYGERIHVGYASMGGWSPFGPERVVTRARGNILYSLDGQPALELYKKYLGEYAAQLPASGLLFPLSVRISDALMPVVRTILAINESENSLTFAGDVPEGAVVRLMKSNAEQLVAGAHDAAIAAMNGWRRAPDLAILISCVGRKLVLKQRTEDEVEAVQEVLGASTVLTGFYSYGEVCPFQQGGRTQLHNQTMTITILSE